MLAVKAMGRWLCCVRVARVLLVSHCCWWPPEPKTTYHLPPPAAVSDPPPLPFLRVCGTQVRQAAALPVFRCRALTAAATTTGRRQQRGRRRGAEDPGHYRCVQPRGPARAWPPSALPPPPLPAPPPGSLIRACLPLLVVCSSRVGAGAVQATRRPTTTSAPSTGPGTTSSACSRQGASRSSRMQPRPKARGTRGRTTGASEEGREGGRLLDPSPRKYSSDAEGG